jgi:hypothetical protein
MGSVCDATGSRGMIVGLAGRISDEHINLISVNDVSIKYYFGQRMTRRRVDASGQILDESAANTITYNDTEYSLSIIQLCEPSHLRALQMKNAPKSGMEAILVMTFRKIKRAEPGEDIIVMQFPLFNATKTDSSEYKISQQVSQYLKEAKQDNAPVTPTIKSLAPFFEEGVTGVAEVSGSLEYVSCVDRDDRISRKMTVRDIVFTGHIVAADALALYKFQPFSPAPNSLITISDINIRQFIYNTVKPVASGKKSVSSAVERATQQYKCMPIDAMRDVNGNMLLIDPATGSRTIKEVVDEDNAVAAALTLDTVPQINKKSVDKYINILLIVIAVLVAVFLACLGLMYVYRFFIEASISGQAASLPAK